MFKLTLLWKKREVGREEGLGNISSLGGGGVVNRLFLSLEVVDVFFIKWTSSMIFLTRSQMASWRFFCLDVVDDSDFYHLIKHDKSNGWISNKYINIREVIRGRP